MRARNYYVYNSDPDILKGLEEDYRSMGRDTKIEGNRLTVFAYTQQKPKAEKKVDRKPKDDVDSPRERDRSQRPKRKE